MNDFDAMGAARASARSDLTARSRPADSANAGSLDFRARRGKRGLRTSSRLMVASYKRRVVETAVGFVSQSSARCSQTGEVCAFDLAAWTASRPNGRFEVAAITVAESLARD